MPGLVAFAESTGFGLAAHAGVLDLGHAAAGIRFQRLVIRQMHAGLLSLTQPLGRKKGAVVRAAQIGIELRRSCQRLVGRTRLAELEEALSDKIGRVGIIGIPPENGSEIRQRRFRLALVEAQNAGQVMRPEIARFFGEHILDEFEGCHLVPPFLPVEGGDGEIEPRVGPLRRSVDHDLEGVPGARIIEVPHLPDAPVVELDDGLAQGDRIGRCLWTGPFVRPIAGGQQQAQHGRQARGEKIRNDVSCFR